MQFIGEHLLPGKLGHFFALLFFCASLVAVFAFFKSANAKLPEEEKSWRRMARRAFYVDVAAVLGVLLTIVYIISNHLFEYNFAWEHSSRSMPLQYLFSCIWEAQEGSFLLWTIWVGALGLVLIRKAGKWESPVMTVISFTHVCLASMLMGLYFFGNKVGFNPFILTRQMDWAANAPIFSRPDYMSIPQMQDGQGLNALLQNYWMTIHPPILFLGFSSTVVPFAYAIAGLWKRQWNWTRAALPWTLFSACVLGTGIMMGAAWAYESLNFGGYWAWDPVENASLVPWLVMIAGLHTMVIYNATGHSLRSTHFFLITQFVLILWSTFLTRSGILGDTSVHAFVDSGMNVQLLLFVVIFLPAYVLFGVRYKHIPHIVKEEATGSREFWMFIGSLVLFLSAVFIIASTSLPAFDQFTGKKFTIGADQEFAYNRIEIFIAILVGLLSAVTQYLKYRGTGWSSLAKRIWRPTVVALVISILVSLFGGIDYNKYGPGFLGAIHVALFAAIYAVVANAGYIWIGLKGKLKAAGPSVAHVGFGIMLVGILISSAKQQVLSYNTTGIMLPFSPESKQDPMENLTLLKGVPTDMGAYTATFVDDDSVNRRENTTYYRIHFDKKDSKEQFDLYPDYLVSTKGGGETAANPDKHHYWNKDIFAYVSATSNPAGTGDTAQFRPSKPLGLHDTSFFSKGYLILDSVIINPNNTKFHFSKNDTALVAKVSVITRDSMRYTAYPALFIKDNMANFLNDTVFAQSLALRFDKVEGSKVELGIKESSQMVPFVALKVLVFPQIALVWIGTIIMIIGFVMSIIWRRRSALAATR